MKNKTAVFFGKFQPPHLGHIITINRILRNFNKLIVGITSDNKIGQDPNQIKKVFEEAFQDYKKILKDSQLIFDCRGHFRKLKLKKIINV